MKHLMPWLKKSLKLILFLIVVGLIIYKVKFNPILVESHTVERSAITDVVMGSGTLDAKVKMIIGSRISGRIEKVLVDQGDLVEKGQLLVTLDDNLLKQEVAVAKASLATAQSSALKVKKDLEIEAAILGNSIKTYNRQKSLVATGATSQGAYDKAAEDLKTARARNSRAQTAVIEAQNKIKEATELLTLRTKQLEDARLLAPFKGKIIKRNLDPGNIVVPGTAALTLVSTDVLWVRAWVDEAALAKIKEGHTAEVVFRSQPERRYPGKVARIAPEVDRETREFIVDVFVSQLPENWAIGQRAEVYIKASEKKSTLTVSETAIRWQNQHSGVFLKKGKKAVWTPVETGIQGKGIIEILEGLNEGDTVVTPMNPKKKLSNHSRIHLK